MVGSKGRVKCPRLHRSVREMELSDNHILFFYHLLLLPTAPFRLTIYNSSVHLLEKKKKKKKSLAIKSTLLFLPGHFLLTKKILLS